MFVEVIGWPSAQPYAFALLFTVISLCLYLSGSIYILLQLLFLFIFVSQSNMIVKTGIDGSQILGRLYYTASIIFYILSVLSKTASISACPVIVLAVEYLRERTANDNSNEREGLPVIIIIVTYHNVH